MRPRPFAFTTADAAAALSGVVIAACFLRFHLFAAAWVAFVPLLWALGKADSPRAAARLGLIAGLFTNVPAFYWLVYTFHVFGGFPYAVAVLIYAILSLYGASQFVVFALLRWRIGPGPLALAAPVVWVTLEFLFPTVFPWRMAHTQWQVPVLIQVGDLTGPYSLSFVLVWVSAGCAILPGEHRRVAPLAAALGSAALIAAYGAYRLPRIEDAQRRAPSVRVALVQGNIGIKEKGDVRYFEVNLEQYRQLSRDLQDDVDVVVWPETVSQHWIEAGRALLEGKENPFPELRGHLIFGGLSFRLTSADPADAEEFNSAFFVAPAGNVVSRYDKRILMPFGEYLPLASRFPSLRKLSPHSGGFTAGTDVAIFELPGKGRIGQLICYEDLVTDMPRRTTQAGAELLVTILNDAWYGRTAAPYQHQALALWRTVENRRYLLRGSNSGVTSVIDAAGRVVMEGGLFRSEVLAANVPRLGIETVYNRFGDVFAWLVAIAALGMGGVSARRPTSRLRLAPPSSLTEDPRTGSE